MAGLLHRYWFPSDGHFGVGVTAFSEDEAFRLAPQVAHEMHWQISRDRVIVDIDVRTLDQGHVIPNMRAPNVRGVWFPMQ